MSAIAGIHIFAERKAKILTSLKAALHDAEFQNDYEAKTVSKEQITGEVYNSDLSEVEKLIGDNLYQSIAIVLYDDYISILFEDAEYEETLARAATYSETFEKPVFFTLMPDSDTVIFGAADRGKVVTQCALGDELYEYDIENKKINMDYMSFIFNTKNLTDLNTCDSASDIVYALDEDYGICADISPLSIPLFGDKYKLLEQSKTFSVYSTL